MKKKALSEIVEDLESNRGIPPRLLPISHKTINDWTQKGLIDDHRERDGQWRMFSLVEFIAIYMYAKLRDVGLSIEKIKKTKELLFHETSFKKKPSGTWDLSKMKSITLATFSVMSGVNENYYIIISENCNKIRLGHEEWLLKYILNTDKNGLSGDPVILMDFKSILSEIRVTSEKKKSSVGSLITSLYDEESNELSVLLKKGEIKSVKQTKYKKYDPKAESLIDLIKEHKNQNISLSINEDGKITTVKQTQNIKS